MAEPVTLARPYAEAAFEFARDADALAAWDEMLSLAAAVAADETVARRVLENPRVEAEAAASFMLDAGGEHFSTEFGNFVKLLAENRRLALLPQVSELFARYRAEAEQTLDVEVTTATGLPDEYRRHLEKSLSKRFGREINIALNVDDSIIGGAVIRAGDTVLDGSVRGRLAKLAGAIRE